MKCLELVRGLAGVALVGTGMIAAGLAHSRSEITTPTLTYLSSYALPPMEVNGLAINELSDLAWDEDEQLLYAVSDKGRIFHFKLSLQNNQILGLTPVYGAGLLNVKGKALEWRDSEGMDIINGNNGIQGDSEVLISLEGLPRVGRFATNGRLQTELLLPKALQDRRQYRSSNTSLESVTVHPAYGYITAPEHPLKKQPMQRHTVYSRSREWHFNAYPAEKSAITSLQTLPNGNLLILERAWSGVWHPLVVSLRYLDFAQCSKTGECPIQNLQVLSSLFLVDNFEGLTHFHDNLYLMVSDDGHSSLQRTLLTLFKLEFPSP